jgi:spore maturation protein CgeB
MKLVIFGLSVSSSWGNGHATLWRGLCRALANRGHRVVFFERDVPYYAATRDLFALPGGAELILYDDWPEKLPAARRHVDDADVAIVTSYCPDAINATTLILDSRTPLKVFYDLDTPITLARLAAGEPVEYIGPRGLIDFDLVLSYTGGRSLEDLRCCLGARAVAPLYGSVDPIVHSPVTRDLRYQADLSYLGTFAPDRADTLRRLFVEPARRLPGHKFLLAGAMYDQQFPWQPNIFFVNHLPPAEHPAFYCSSRLTLNVTRRAMAETGYCPSARLFEATACGAAVLSDAWEGIEQFFEPESEILLARETGQAVEAIDRSPEELARVAAAARARTLSAHTADARAAELEHILSGVRRGQVAATQTEVA